MPHSTPHWLAKATAMLMIALGNPALALEPVLVRDLNNGPGSSSPCEFVTVNGLQLFAAADSSGRELWKTDGTYLTSQRVKDIFNSGSNSSFPSGFFVFTSTSLGEIALFTAQDSTTGSELWRSDGTESGTQRVADLNPGSGSSNPADYVFVPSQGKVYFRAYDGSEIRLYQTDGMSTSVLTTLGLNSLEGSIATLGGNLFVNATEGVGQPFELFRIDLPAATWQIVADINAGLGSSPSNLTTIGSSIYMTAYTDAAGREPYVTNGSIGNLVSLGDLRAGTPSSFPKYFTPFSGWVYFSSSEGLSRTQGTLETTETVLAGAGGPLIDSGSLLYFPAFDNGVGYEPYVTNGTTVTLVEDIQPGPGSSLNLWQAAIVNGSLVFNADDGVHGFEPWESTDGTPAGTNILADIEPGTTSSNPECFRDFGSYGLLRATQTPFGSEPFALVSTGYDFGDAPDTYGTALAGDGARHALGSGLSLGSIVEPELDRPYESNALADDLVGFDDEDGVVFEVTLGSAAILGLGEEIRVDVTASAAGVLDAWIDFNRDGDFLDLDEKLTFTDVDGADVSGGLNTKTFDVPVTATTGVSYARFRLTSSGTSSPIGLEADGEVEDYYLVLAGLDFGDAPDANYATLRSSQGARHALSQGPLLGLSVDADADGQPSSGANGDDTNGSDDEDGITVPTLSPGSVTTIAVQVSDSLSRDPNWRGGGSPGLLNAWVDFNIDGDWDDAGEQVFQDQSVSFGTNMLGLTVPGGATEGMTMARFRLSSVGGLGTTGLAVDGEVEDYSVLIATIEADLQISKTDGQTTAAPGGQVTYTIVASNPSGPQDALNSRIVDDIPSELSNCVIECTAAGGADCGAADRSSLGSPEIDQFVDLPVGGSVTLTATCTVDGGATGSLSNTATVSVPVGVIDPNPGDNTATDIDTLVPEADLSISKTDGLSFVVQPATLTYTVLAENPGPSDAYGALITDTLPIELDNVSWTCVGMDGGACVASGIGDISESVDLPAGAAVTFTVLADVVATAPATIENTATVAAPAGVSDPNGANDLATDVTAVEEDGSVIFFDGFESGDTTQWSAARRARGTIDLPFRVDDLDVYLELEPKSVERTGRAVALVASGSNWAGTAIFRLNVETQSGRYRMVPSLRNVEGDWVSGQSVWLDRIPARVRLNWRRSLVGANDGALYVLAGSDVLGWLDGVVTPDSALSSLQTYSPRGRPLVRAVLQPDGQAITQRQPSRR